MPALNPKRQLEIAARVHDTYDAPARWSQGDWGVDESGEAIGVDGALFIADPNVAAARRPPSLHASPPDSPRCWCLGTAVVLHTCDVLGLGPSPDDDPSPARDAAEAMCAIYTRRAGIDTVGRERDATHIEPALQSLVAWNDAAGRTFEEVRALTRAVVRDLEAHVREAPNGTMRNDD